MDDERVVSNSLYYVTHGIGVQNDSNEWVKLNVRWEKSCWWKESINTSFSWIFFLSICTTIPKSSGIQSFQFLFFESKYRKLLAQRRRKSYLEGVKGGKNDGKVWWKRRNVESTFQKFFFLLREKFLDLNKWYWYIHIHASLGYHVRWPVVKDMVREKSGRLQGIMPLTSFASELPFHHLIYKKGRQMYQGRCHGGINITWRVSRKRWNKDFKHESGGIKTKKVN